MAYDTDFANANDTGLQEKVRVAMCSTAIAVVGESPSGTPNGPLHLKRHALGVAVLADGGSTQLQRFMFAAVAGGALTPASNDAAIDTRLSSIWNDLAGVSQTDG